MNRNDSNLNTYIHLNKNRISNIDVFKNQNFDKQSKYNFDKYNYKEINLVAKYYKGRQFRY